MRLLPEAQLAQQAWDAGLLQHPDGHFLQSWAWGEFQKTIGNRIWRLAVEDQGTIISQLLVIELGLGFGWSILYAPRGTLVNKHLSVQAQQESSRLLLAKLHELAKSLPKAILFRIDPPVLEQDPTATSLYRSLGFRPNTKKHLQPRHSLIVDLTKPKENLLADMKQKTRYNIKLAQKHNITIEASTNPEDIEAFIHLTATTAERNRFVPHSTNYYRTQFEVLSKAGIQELWVAKLSGTPLAAILVNTFGSTATYVHGGSDNSQRNLMAPYLLQFTAMLDAKERGVANYDFWGIHPDPDHAWAGITRFKLGFGGNPVTYLHTLELPFKPTLYKLYTWLSRYR